MSRPTCTRCDRTLIDTDTWQATPRAQRRTLYRTHAQAAYKSGLCTNCYEHQAAERDLAYRGGWARDSHGIMRPTGDAR